MAAITLSATDGELWNRARAVAGPLGLSALVERALRAELSADTSEQRFSLQVRSEGQPDEVVQRVEFFGRLLLDSESYSVGQLPRLRVYQTSKGRLVVYRTWPEGFRLEPTFLVFEDLNALESDPGALATTWITESDPFGEREDLTPQFAKALRRLIRRPHVIDPDELKPTELAGRQPRDVRLPRDASRIRAALIGRPDQDVLLVAMHLIDAVGQQPCHLSHVEDAFRELKPVSRHGNRAEDLKDLQANMRGYLNNDTRKRQPAHRLFTNPRRGYWALSPIGDRRAREVLHHLGLVRAV